LVVKLNSKQEKIQKLKILFVEKLKELETSFVEIGNEVAESG
jgi:ribosomal protein L21